MDSIKMTLSGKIKKFYQNNTVMKCFFTAVFSTFALHTIISIFAGFDFFKLIFFSKCKDLFMDFFNSVRDASQGAKAYTVRNIIYPPMANFIFYAISKLTPLQYNSTTNDYKLTWIEYPSAIISFAIFIIIPLTIYIYLVVKNMKRNSISSGFGAVALCFNLPLLYMLERGNIIIYAIIALFYFIFNYDSVNKFNRNFANIALAFSFSIKLYPAIFGWILVKEKRWKDIFFCVLYAILFTIIPSFGFGGPKTLLWMFENITNFTSSSSSFGNHFLSSFYQIYTKFIFVVAFICFLIMPFVIDNKMKYYTLGVATILVTPSLYSAYAMSMFVPTLIMYFNQESADNSHKDKFDLSIIIMLIVDFSFVQYGFYIRETFIIIPNIICILSIIQVIIAFFTKIKNKQSVQTNNATLCE